MFSPKLKTQIAEAVQQILQEVDHDELPDGEVQFILHVDGAEYWSYANIRNMSAVGRPVPDELFANLSV